MVLIFRQKIWVLFRSLLPIKFKSTWKAAIKAPAEKRFEKAYALEASEKVRSRKGCRKNVKVMTMVLQT